MAGQKYSNRKYVERSRERMLAAGLPSLNGDILKPITALGEDSAAALIPDLERTFEDDMTRIWRELHQRREAEIIASGGSMEDLD
jgi:hypothetical protein